MVNGVADAGILGDTLVCKIELAIGIDSDVLQQGVAADGVVDVGFAVFVEVDDFGVAAAFEVEHAVVVPAVLVVADEETFRVGGEGGFACAAEAEEDGGVLAFHIGVCGAVHRGDALEREVVVHHAEHSLFHLTAVPGVEDYLLAGSDVECHAGFAVEAKFLVVLHFGFAGRIDCEAGGEGF